ncbi:MAG: hypothetical protein C5S41_08200 [Candidatus Methanomarinus sp.]|nr:MAG: hypothetical protein C5S41_08200 [ANME-2 cluster archaeon]
MKLKREDTDLFYRLNWSLLFYVNQKYSVIKDLKEPFLKDENPRKIVELNEILYSNTEHIDSFVLENPFNFDNEELDIIKGWKKHLKGKFLIVAHLKKYSVFMTPDKESIVYGVLGLYDEIEDIVPLFIPSYVNTILLPFKGQIIYNGFIMSYNINIAGNMKRGIQDEYQQAKRKFGIITSLDTPIREKEDSDEELIKFYTKSISNRETYWEEIDELLAKKPSLENVYHREIGKSNARKISKRISEIGVVPAWFAVYEDVVIASGKSEKVVRAQIADMLPEKKIEGAYVFRYGKSLQK